MRIAMVSPYSWTYPGGVTRHIESLSGQLRAAGHDVRILAPFDPDDALSARLHRGARPQPRPRPEQFISLGRSVGLRANGAVSNVAITARAIVTCRQELRSGRYDVVHLHEPVAPLVCWDAMGVCPVPLVGTYHTYSENLLTNNGAALLGARRRMNRLHDRIAVSEAAAWTARRFFGGRYRIVPNGVDLDAEARQAGAAPRTRAADEPLRVLFVGQAVERKGLPVLLRAFEALRDHIPAELTLVGASREEVSHLMLDDRGVTALGKISDAEKRARLRDAHVLCAPSLSGESFGMVLTEAFAAGTPVIASDIPGYRDVARDGQDSLLVPRSDPVALAEALRDLALDDGRRCRLAVAARARATRFAWPRVAGEVLEAYEAALVVPAPRGAWQRAGVRSGILPADLLPRVPARRLPSLEPQPLRRSGRALALSRRLGLAVLSLAGAVLTAIALQRIGLPKVAASLVASRPGFLVLGLALMGGAMAVRGLAWHAILRAAPALEAVRRADALQGTFVGVLMSATLPARLGEASRALVVARRLGRPRETLPVVLGTMLSQTLINLLVLAALGTFLLSTLQLSTVHGRLLLMVTLAPAAAMAVALLSPALLPRAAVSRWSRLEALVARWRRAVLRVRAGLRVFGRPRLAVEAIGAQLLAWGLQLMSCYFLLMALGLSSRVGFAGAAAVLFAVNVTAVIPATPANVGVFQAACVFVLHGAFHASVAGALAYGLVLQAVEMVAAVTMGVPALVREGLTWRELRLRTIHAAPVQLTPRAADRSPAAAGTRR